MENKGQYVAYRTQSGKLCNFDISKEACSKFGFLSGQKVLTSAGRGTVIGVYMGDTIWFHIDGYEGATYWNCVTESFCSELSNDNTTCNKHDNICIPYQTDEHKKNVLMDTSKEACYKYGVLSGQLFVYQRDEATVIGVHDNSLWILHHIESIDGGYNDKATRWRETYNPTPVSPAFKVEPTLVTAHVSILTGYSWILANLCSIHDNGYCSIIQTDDKENIYMTGHTGGLTVIQKHNRKPKTVLFKDGRNITSLLWFDHILYACESYGPIYGTCSRDRILQFNPKTDKNFTLLAGNGNTGYKDGSFKKAEFDSLSGIAADKNGDLYVTEHHRVRKLNMKTRTVETVAGCTTKTKDGGHRDGEAMQAMFSYPRGIVVTNDGTIYVCEHGNNCIRQIKDGMVSTIAGHNNSEYRDGPADQAGLQHPEDLILYTDGSLIFSDHYRLRRLDLEKKLVSSFSYKCSRPRLAMDSKAKIYLHTGYNIVRLQNTWRAERVLWIGHLKENPNTCVFARLPKVVMQHIIDWRNTGDNVFVDGLLNKVY